MVVVFLRLSEGREEGKNVGTGRKISRAMFVCAAVMVSSPYIPKWQVTEIAFLLPFF